MDFQLNSKILPPPKNIKISHPKGPGKLLIVWDSVKNPDAKITTGIRIKHVRYNVYRSTSLGGIFYKLNNVPLKNTRYEDSNVNKHPNSQYFYKVSTVIIYSDEKTTSEGNLSDPVLFQIPTENRWFKKINERNMWILKNTGVLMDVYRRKVEGPRCRVCYDKIREQGDPDCTSCFGTTFDGGYEPMTQIYIRQKPAVEQVQLIQQGYVVDNNPGAWTISPIELTNRDLMFNPFGKLFAVMNSNISHAAGYMFHQELQMKELDPTDKRYEIKRITMYPSI
jgi:hypothetical protein